MVPWPPVPGISASLMQGALAWSVPSISTHPGGQPVLWGACSWAKKAGPGGQAFPSHPHLHASLPVLSCCPGGSPSQGDVPWPPSNGGAVEAPHFWRSTFLPDFQGFLLNPARNLRGKLRKTPQGSPQTGNDPPGPCSGQGAGMGSKLSSPGGRGRSPSP